MSDDAFDLSAPIYVAGHRGLVGSALLRRLQRDGAKRIVLRTHDELDLTNQGAVDRLFASEKPQYVFLAAARVGGIRANSTYPAEFIRDNLAIQTNVIHSAWMHGTKKLLFLGSSCIYPKFAPQPIREEYLLTGLLEPTNEWYAVAKIAGIKMCQAYRQQYGFDAICAMPTNLYGPGDNFDPDNSHVIPGLIRRIHEATLRAEREVTIWGTGNALREFLHVDDLVDALLLLMRKYSDAAIVNVGSGYEIGIAQLARSIAEIIGFPGRLAFDASKPDGAPRKLLDTSLLASLAWRSGVPLNAGLEETIASYMARS